MRIASIQKNHTWIHARANLRVVFLYAGSAIYTKLRQWQGVRVKILVLAVGMTHVTALGVTKSLVTLGAIYLEDGQYPTHLPHSDTTKRRN